MGNCVSASSATIAPRIRVVQASEAQVVEVELPPLQSSMKVGELMLEFSPGHFVAQLDRSDLLNASTSIKRAAPLGADADAKPGAVYVLFPMPRLHTRITPQELLSFAKHLHLQDHEQGHEHLTRNSSRVLVRALGCFTTSTRVAPLVEEEEQKDVDCYIKGVEYSSTQACPSPIGSTEHSADTVSSPGCILSSYLQGGHMGVIKPKPWVPTLQTIMESS